MYLYFTLSGLSIAITSTILGLFVFLKNRKSKVNQTFALFCLSTSVWSWFYIFWPLAKDRESTLFWFRMLHIGSIFISITYFHFVVTWLNLYQKKKKIVFFGYCLAIFFLLFVFSPLFIKDMVPKFSMRYWAEPGILYHFYLLMFFGFAVYSWYLMFKGLRELTGIKRSQVKYVLIGTLIGFLGGSTNYFLWYDIPVYPYGNILVTVYIALTAYAIVKYRLMDIRVVIGKSAVYLFSFATVIALALGMVSLNNRLSLPVSTNIAYIVILVVSILLFQPIFRFYEKIASRYFYYTFYSSQKVITGLGKKLTGVLELNKLCSLITNTLINTMKLDKAGVLLRDSETGQYKIQKIIGFKKENGISLVKDNFLTIYLERTKKPLVYEEISLVIRDIRDEVEKERLEKLRVNMKRIEAKLCLPLLREEKITGMIILGSKISGEPYSEQDLELLMNLSNQASIALENAKLYAQVQDLSQNLQKKVDEQTKEIKKAYEVEKEAHKELKRLDKAKDQFMLATQHYLRTPLTSMRGYLDLILGGSYGELKNKKIKEKLKRLETSSQRLSKMINELLDISQFQLGKEVVAFQPNIQIEPILKEIIEELKPEAETKKIYLKLQGLKKKLTSIKADSEKLKMALFNIIDNGIKYTDKGGVTIEVKSIEDKLQIIVKDTGMGISKEELKTLFIRTFERSEQAKKVYTTGRGIGLYIASQIIEAHQGRVWVESKGKGKGSTFYVELPIG